MLDVIVHVVFPNGDEMDNARNEIKKMKLLSKRNTIVLIVILFIMAGAGGTLFFYNKYQEIKNNPSLIAKQDANALIAEISNITVLPIGEDPTIATITDIDKLKDQIFFKDAENNDKLLVYIKAQKAILYRPSSKKIINIAPINMNADKSTNTTTK